MNFPHRNSTGGVIARPWRQLAWLALLVVLLHVGTLGWLEPSSPLRLAPPLASASAFAFATRTIEPPAPPPAPSPVVLAAAPSAPAPTPAAPAPPAPAAKQAPAPQRPIVAAAALPAPRIAQPVPAPHSPTPTAVAAAEPAPKPAPAPAPPATPMARAVLVPPSARHHYDVALQAKGISLRGQGELEWRHDGHQYEAKLELSNPFFPKRIQRSTGRITEDGLAPGYFLDKSRNEQATHFDREKGRVTFSNNRPPAQLEAGLQDRLSVLMQLAALVGGQPAKFKAGTEIAVPTASTRETEDWIFAVEGEEDLQLPGGAVRALKLHRKPRKEFDQRLELWLAPRMDYAPVRIRLTNPNGDTVDQRWSSTDKG